MFEICSKKKKTLLQNRGEKKPSSLSQEAYLLSTKYTLEPQFDGEPEKGFQKHGDVLVNWDIL